MGTVHAIPSSLFSKYFNFKNFGELASYYLANVDILLQEMDVNRAHEMLIYENKPSLNDLLREDELFKIGKILDEAIVHVKNEKYRGWLEHVKRTYQVDGTYMALCSYALSKIENPIFMDYEFFLYAKEYGIPCIGLETPEEQKECLIRIPTKEKVRDIREFLAGDYLSGLEKIWKVYCEGDLENVMRSCKKTTLFKRAAKRSVVLYRRAKPYFNEKAVVAIGCGHLSTFVKLANQDGFTVSKLALHE